MAGGNVPRALAPVFVAAGQQYKIPAAVLAGVASVETNLGANQTTSSTGAQGLMQFEPGTAASIGLHDPNNDRASIFAAAKLLNQYGYQTNPLRALGAYNGGPGNPQYGYANQVMAESRRLASQLAGQSSASLPSTPGMASPGIGTGGGQARTQSYTTFNQAAFQAAQAKAIAGQYLQSAPDPYKIPIPSTDVSQGAELSTGLPTGPQSNPLLATGLLPTAPPNPADFRQTHQAHMAAHNALQNMAATGGSQAPLNVHPGAVGKYAGYVNPIPHATIGQVDMGVDINLPVGAPIRAIGDSRVVGIAPGWYAGQPYVLLQLLNGPQKGKYYYVSEQITPKVKAGQVLATGDTIGTYAASGTGIEIGWGSAVPGRTLTQATAPQQVATRHAGHGTDAGNAFRQFLHSLGAG